MASLRSSGKRLQGRYNAAAIRALRDHHHPCQRLVWLVLTPLGGFALNAIHPTSAGESPLLSVMAGGFYVAISLPVLLVAALLYYKLRQGRNWARIVHSVFVALMMIPLISDFRLANLVHGGHWGVADMTSFALFRLPYPAAYIVAAVLLFSATARAWFAGERDE
jgi:hypothetical protein